MLPFTPPLVNIRFFVSLSISLFFLFLTIPAFAATTIPFTINLSEAVNVTGTPRIAVDVGGVTRYATYTSGTGTSTLTFTYTMVAGDVDLDGVTVSSPMNLNGGTIKDLAGNDATLTFTPPNTTNVKVNYPSLGMDFIYDADGRYTLNGTVYNDLTSFLSAAGGSFTRASVGTYFDSTGTLQTASSGVPRFDYDPTTHVAKGILIEESRTNYLLNSAQLNQTGWNTRSGSTSAPSATTAPDGGATSYLETKASGDGYVWQFFNPSASTTYTYSIFVKGGASSSSIFFNRWDGTTAGTSPSITINPGQPWTRLSFTFTTSATVGSGDFGFFIGANPFWVWGAQLEQGSFPTSYIPTTTAAVTRPADYLTMPTGSWYNQSAGTFYDNTEWVSMAGANYPMFFRVDDTTNNNRWNAYYKQSTSVVGVDAFNSNVGQGSWLSTATSTSGTKKLATAQSLNNANVAFDGIIQTVDTSWTLPTVTRLVLSGGSSTASIWKKSLKYYPLRVSDAQLQLLTQ